MRILDLCACEGGAGMGYHRAGWDVEGVELDKNRAAWDMVDPVALCGCMFDLSTEDTDGVTIHLQRLRLFETNWGMTAPRLCDHSAHEWVAGAYGGARRDKYEAKYVRKGGYVPKDKEVVKRLLGIDHDVTWGGLFESVPPAYTEYIGRQLMAAITERKAAA